NNDAIRNKRVTTTIPPDDPFTRNQCAHFYLGVLKTLRGRGISRALSLLHGFFALQLPGLSCIKGNRSCQVFGGCLTCPDFVMKFTNFIVCCGVLVNTFSGSRMIFSIRPGSSFECSALR